MRIAFRWALVGLLVLSATALPVLSQSRQATPPYRCVFEPVAIGMGVATLAGTCSTFIGCFGGFFAVAMAWWDTVASCRW